MNPFQEERSYEKTLFFEGAFIHSPYVFLFGGGSFSFNGLPVITLDGSSV